MSRRGPPSMIVNRNRATVGVHDTVGRAASAAIALAAILLASSSWAQQAQSNPFASGGAQSIPPGRETLVDLSTQVEYNSNVAASDRLVAAQRGLTLADELFTPGVDFTVARQLGRALVFARGSASYAFYVVNTVRDRADVDLNLGASTHFGPCQENLTGEYSRTQTSLSELALGIINNTEERKNVAFAANCGRGVGLAPTFSVTQAWLNNSAGVLQSVNNQSLTFDGALGYERPALGTLSLFGDYVSASYPDRTNASFPGGPVIPPGVPLTYGYDIYGGGVRFERPVGTRIDALLSVSYTSLQPNTAGAAGFSGLTYSGDVTYSLTSRIRTHANIARATQPSNRIDANFSVNDTYEADLTYLFGQRLSVMLSGQSKNINYIVPANIRINDLTHEHTYDALLSVTFQMTKRLSFILSGGDEERTANFPGLSYSATKVTLEARASF